jgi:hypothetical protein
MNWIVYNRSESNLTLVIEPSAIAYEICPGSKVMVEGNFIESSGGFGEIEVSSDNTVSLYLELGATVLENGKPPKLAAGW